MKVFTRLRSCLMALPAANIDTDQILPASYMKGLTRDGLGVHLFDKLRHDESGAPRPEFILNRPENADAQILLSGPNFGCGSSREHAVWALVDHGIRCIIAPSFGMIFAGNCARNGLLLISPDDSTMARLHESVGTEIEVDLERECITLADGSVLPFAIDARVRTRLLNGQDDIQRTLAHVAEIDAFEAAAVG